MYNPNISIAECRLLFTISAHLNVQILEKKKLVAIMNCTTIISESIWTNTVIRIFLWFLGHAKHNEIQNFQNGDYQYGQYSKLATLQGINKIKGRWQSAIRQFTRISKIEGSVTNNQNIYTAL